MEFGSAWYPEHWPEERWPEDVRLMRGVHMNVTRLGEFAWSRLEPEEGVFDIDWLVRAVDVAGAQGIRSVVGTPSAAPPAWLTQRYPETLALHREGHRARHGGRCHCSLTSLVFRHFATRIAEQMARKLGHNPNVIGWQIDNEFGVTSYDDETRAHFQVWLRDRYGSLEELNRRWATAFWSQEYGNWEQIPVPVGFHNPSLNLEFKRFQSDNVRSFQKKQIDAIRRHADPKQWITHNFMGFYSGFDHYDVAEDLDLVSWDDYISHGHLDYLANGAAHDLTRGFKRQNFWVMETQIGWTCGGTSQTQNALDQGEMRTFQWHQIGHGADAILYWQWRSALGGQEQYGGTVVYVDGEYRRQHIEVRQIGDELARTSNLLAGTTPVADCALLHSYDDRWIINNFRQNLDFDPVEHLLAYYRPLRAVSDGIDIVAPTADLSGYKLVVAPHLHILNEERLRNLTHYVEGGGHLLLGARSGMKNDDDAFIPMRQPGPLASLLGAHVDEWYGLDRPAPVEGEWGSGESRNWAELLQVDVADAEVLLRWGKSNGWLDGEPALVTRKFGKGRISYLGAWLDPELMAKAVAWASRASGLEAGPVVGPPGVEVCRRSGAGKDVFIVVNHTHQEARVAVSRQFADALTGATAQAELVLGPLGVAVLH